MNVWGKEIKLQYWINLLLIKCNHVGVIMYDTEQYWKKMKKDEKFIYSFLLGQYMGGAQKLAEPTHSPSAVHLPDEVKFPWP